MELASLGLGGGGITVVVSMHAKELESAKTDKAVCIQSSPTTIAIFISILTRPPTTFSRLVTYSNLNSTVHVMIVTELFVIHFQVPRRGFRQYFLEHRAVRQYRVLYCNYRPFTVRSITSQNP